MSTVPASSSTPSTRADYDAFISEQVRKTQTGLRLVDVASSLMTIAAFVIAYLLVWAVVDHWVIKGGLGVWGRVIALIFLIAAVVAYAVRAVLPYFRYRINPVYAAQTIENAEPSLKNGLVNFLFLRRGHAGLPDVVYRSLEKQTAAKLARVTTEATVDRSGMTRVSYALIGILIVSALYVVFSPKNVFPSVGRVLAPWADIDPVTRVRIEDIQPGDAEAVRLTEVEVTARIRGLSDEETVKLVYSTTDNRAVNIEVPMYLGDDQMLHACTLPSQSGGMSQDMLYRVEAGDCVSPTYRITVVDAPTFQVKSIEYQYPEYTGLESRRLEDIGDIKAIEGTYITIRAEASQEIVSANVHLEGLRDQTVPMRHEGRAAAYGMTLARKSTGVDSVPEWTGYRLRFTTPQGNSNQDPIRHRIEITRDEPPVVEILAPTSPVVKLPADGQLLIEVRGRDPDFHLAELRLESQVDGKPLFAKALFDQDNAPPASVNEAQRASFNFVASEYQLKAGDVVRYKAVAQDNKTPQPNRTETPNFRIEIIEPEGRSRDIPAEQPEEKDKPASAPSEDQRGQGSDDGQNGQGGSGGSESSEEDGPQDGQQGSDSGEASSTNEKSNGDTQPKDGQQGSGNDQANQPNSGDPQQGDSSRERGQPDSSPKRDGEQSGQGETSQGSPEDAGPQSGAEAEDGQGSEPIDNDGEAFKEALEHIRRSQKESPQPPGEGKSQPSDQPSEGQPSDPGDQQDETRARTAGETAEGGSDQGGENGAGDQGDRPSSGDDAEPKERPDSQPGDGKQPTDDGQQGSKQDSETGAKKDMQDGGGGKDTPGEGTPPPEGDSTSREKSGDTSQSDRDKGSDAKESSTSKRDSDSAEGNSGSLSGKGEEGGGQKSKQAGEGQEGSNTPAETGGSPADQSGQGDNSTRPGDDTLSDTKTGRSSDQAGNASESKDGTKGEGTENQQPETTPGSESKPAKDRSNTESEGGQPGEGQPGAETSRGGQPGDSIAEGTPGADQQPEAADSSEPPSGNEPEPDAANLEFARKQTELVLDYLQDQLDKNQIDPELKRKFGWTDEQFRDFVKRHSQLRKLAQEPGDQGREAREELDDTLRSLGLRPASARVRTGTPAADKARGLNQSSRTRPPQEYQDQFDAFRKDAFGNR